MTKKLFECEHCHATYVREKSFLKHECPVLLKKELLKTTTGMAAYNYFCYWCELKQRMKPAREHFIESRYFLQFNNFALFVKRIKFPSVKQFIKCMHLKNLDPNLWTNNQVYSIYLEYMQIQISPLESMEVTIDFLFKESEKREIDVSEFFEKVPPSDIMEYVRQCYLSPWILLNSRSFKRAVRVNFDAYDKKMVEDMIRPMYWNQRFKKDPKMVSTAQQYTSEMKI